MPWTIVRHFAQATGASGNSTTARSTIGATSIFIAVANNFSATSPGTTIVTDSASNTWIMVAASGCFGGSNPSIILYQVDPTTTCNTSASHTFTITTAGNSSHAVAGVALAQTGTIAMRQARSAYSTSSPLAPGSVRGLADDALLLSIASGGANAAAWSVNASFTAQSVASSTGVNYGIAMGYLEQSTPSAVNPSWTNTGATALAGLNVVLQSQTSGSFVPLEVL